MSTVEPSKAIWLMCAPYGIALDKVTHLEQIDTNTVRVHFTSFGFVDARGDLESLMEQIVLVGAR